MSMNSGVIVDPSQPSPSSGSPPGSQRNAIGPHVEIPVDVGRPAADVADPAVAMMLQDNAFVEGSIPVADH
ncbi:hypothetical protein ACFQWH_15180 [Mycolicibacterium sp. GCM10028919]|uniref:hypothetical protein n=1 Tax=Mycolicibacterium sp. GCM10028919 TaxID=3273401 RepID=UPI00361B565F